MIYGLKKLSPKQKASWFAVIIVIPYVFAASLTMSALKADALDDRRYELMLRSFANRLESDEICQKIAKLSSSTNSPCQQLSSQAQNDQGPPG